MNAPRYLQLLDETPAAAEDNRDETLAAAEDNREETPAEAEDNRDETPAAAEDKREKWITNVFIGLCCIFEILGSVAAIGLHFFGDGETALHLDRIFATFGAVLMIISFIRILYIWCKLKPIDSKKAKDPLPVTIGFFIFVMTLGAFYGYFEKITKIRIFWKYDFVLHYYPKYKECDLIMDCFYAAFVLIYLLFQCFYFMFIAPVTHISRKDVWCFICTLFINALQKWVFESIEVHMEMCEEFNHVKHMCKTYINYTTSIKDLSHHQQEIYSSTTYLDPLTYTITIELFFAYIALLLHFSHHDGHEENHVHNLQPEPNNDAPLGENPGHNNALVEINREPNQQPEKIVVIKTPKLCKFFIWFICLTIAVLFLAIIHMAPVIFVWPNHTSHRWERVSFRLSAYGLSAVLTLICYSLIFVYQKPTSFVYQQPTSNNGRCQNIGKQLNKYYETMNPDIKLLWFAWIVNLAYIVVKFIIERIFLFDTFKGKKDEGELKLIYWLGQLGNGFEAFSYLILILLVGKLFKYAEKVKSNEKNNFVAKFVLFYGILALLNFVACYKLKSLYYNLEDIESENGLNWLILIQSTYPATLLFNMTLCLCFATIGETLFQKGFYKFAEKKDFETILSNSKGCLEIDYAQIEEEKFLTIVFHRIEFENVSEPKKVKIIIGFVKIEDLTDEEVVWNEIKKTVGALNEQMATNLHTMNAVFDKTNLLKSILLQKIRNRFPINLNLTKWLIDIQKFVKERENAEEESAIAIAIANANANENQWLSSLKWFKDNEAQFENLNDEQLNKINKKKEIIQPMINILSDFPQFTHDEMLIIENNTQNEEAKSKAKAFLAEIEQNLVKQFISKVLNPSSREQIFENCKITKVEEKIEICSHFHSVFKENVYELTYYLTTTFLNNESEKNLEFWNNLKVIFPNLQNLAFKYHSIPSFDMEGTQKSLNILKKRIKSCCNCNKCCNWNKFFNFCICCICCKFCNCCESYTPEKASKYIIGRSLSGFEEQPPITLKQYIKSLLPKWCTTPEIESI